MAAAGRAVHIAAAAAPATAPPPAAAAAAADSLAVAADRLPITESFDAAS